MVSFSSDASRCAACCIAFTLSFTSTARTGYHVLSDRLASEDRCNLWRQVDGVKALNQVLTAALN
jgi:hypothetical protein